MDDQIVNRGVGRSAMYPVLGLIALMLVSPLVTGQTVAANTEIPMERDVARLAGDPDFDYRFGMALVQAGRSGEALFAFERVLMTTPGNSPAHIDARLKIAQINLERGALTNVREVLAPLLGKTLNDGQQKTLERLRADLDTRAAASGSGISVRGYVLAGLGRDDNVTGGPNLVSILLPGSATPGQPARPTALGTAAQDADSTRVLETGLILRQPVGENTWLAAGGSIRQGYNNRRNDVRDGYISADLGLIHRSDKEFFGGSLLAQDYRVAGITYRRSLGLRGNWVHPLEGGTVLTTFAQILDFRHPANVIDDSTRKTIGITAESALSGGASVLRYGFYWGDDQAKDASKPHFSYRLAGVQVGASYRANDDLSFTANASVEQRSHKAQDALHLLMRRDNQTSLGLALDYQFSPGWHVIPQYTQTRNATTAALYEYSRRTFLTQLRWDFDNEK